jgi:glycosyltransferase involved in cell wall biosynthesis
MQALHASGPPCNESLLIDRRLPAGWAHIRLKMTASTPGRLRLYADGSDDFRPATCLLNLEVGGAVEYDGFVCLASPVSALRLESPAGAGDFRSECLRIEPLSNLQAFGHALISKVKLLRKYWHTKQALGRALGMLARGDFARLRQKLFQGLNGPDLEGQEPYDEIQAYEAWRLSRRLTDEDRAGLRAEAAPLADPPCFSVLLSLIGKCEPDARRSIESVLRQTHPYWELCIWCGASADAAVKTAVAEYAARDSRIRFTDAISPAGTAAATNAALASASGEYVTLLDEGDELAEHALSKLSKSVIGDLGLDMLYADEDRLTPEGRASPFFKPDWSPESLLGWMYIGRPGVYRTALVRELGGFRAEYDLACEYDLALRVAAGSPRVRHVADVLYHRRMKAPSSEPVEDAARRALQSHLEGTKRKGTVEAGPAPGLHRVRLALRGAPSVSIIIPSACRRVRIRGGKTYYLLKCLESIQKSTWSRYEIVVLHGPKVPPVLARRLKQEGVVHAAYDSPFNWSKAMNQGAALAQGDHLLFLNDDVEVITPDWLEQLLEFSQQADIGAVGAKLFFPGGRIQHAGVAVLDGRPQHPFYAHHGEHPGYFNNLLVPRNCGAVTGACLMTRADVFHSVGGFDEALPLNYNDVDYCLRLNAIGRRVVCTPYARLYHHELGTRPAEVRPEETEALRQRWGKAWAHDPYYNPNLSTSHFDYRIRSVSGESAGRHGPE